MTHESQARWYAIKVVLNLFIIMGGLIVIAYVDIFWAFVAVVLLFAIIFIGAIYSDAYYNKLLELKENERR